MAGILMIIIDTSIKSIIKKSEIQSDIHSRCFLPFQIFVIPAGSKRLIERIADLILRGQITQRIPGEIFIISDFLLSSQYVAQTKFQIPQRIDFIEKIIFTHPPAKYKR